MKKCVVCRADILSAVVKGLPDLCVLCKKAQEQQATAEQDRRRQNAFPMSGWPRRRRPTEFPW